MHRTATRAEVLFVSTATSLIVFLAMVSCLTHGAIARHEYYDTYTIMDICWLASNEPDLVKYIFRSGRFELALIFIVVTFWSVYFVLSHHSWKLMFKAWLLAILLPISACVFMPYITFVANPAIAFFYLKHGFDGEIWSDGAMLWLVSHFWLILCIGMAIRCFLPSWRETKALATSNTLPQ